MKLAAIMWLIQTDNGVEFTNKYISEKNIRREKEPKLSAFEQEVADLKIRHFKIANKIAKETPELNGKVERFNRTIKKAMQNQLKLFYISPDSI